MHLAGNYGSAWQNQQKNSLTGAIVMTSNCLLNPQCGFLRRPFVAAS
ncbi:hypothetical protein O9929_11430 [Vibrio lentus]|nr:hypothetical protein [Vibrio lentus]